MTEAHSYPAGRQDFQLIGAGVKDGSGVVVGGAVDPGTDDDAAVEAEDGSGPAVVLDPHAAASSATPATAASTTDRRRVGGVGMVGRTT